MTPRQSVLNVRSSMGWAGHEDYLQAWMLCHETLRELGAGHAGHPDVTEHEIDRLWRAGRYRERLHSVAGLEHLVPLDAELPDDQPAERYFVIHHKNRGLAEADWHLASMGCRLPVTGTDQGGTATVARFYNDPMEGRNRLQVLQGTAVRCRSLRSCQLPGGG